MNIKELKEYFKYDKVTGKLFWNRRPSNRVLLGQEVGNHNDQGYKVCRFNGKAIRVHRIVWALNKEELPSGFIDHINGIKDDNRMENLRLVSNAQNLQNMKQAKGYTFHKKNNKWMAQISINNQYRYLGSFDTEQEAHYAYLKAKEELHPYFVKEHNDTR